MPDTIPPMPVGANGQTDEEVIFLQWVWRMCKREFVDTPTVKWEVDGNSIRAHVKPTIVKKDA